jgi:hypothetical protein
LETKARILAELKGADLTGMADNHLVLYGHTFDIEWIGNHVTATLKQLAFPTYSWLGNVPTSFDNGDIAGEEVVASWTSCYVEGEVGYIWSEIVDGLIEVWQKKHAQKQDSEEEQTSLTL